MADQARAIANASVFVVHTPFQVFVAEQMLRTTSLFREGDRVLALELLSEACRVDTALWSQVLQLPVIGGSVAGRGRACRRALSQLAEVVGEYSRCEILVSDIAWPLNNAIATKLGPGQRPGVALSIFPDGLIMYLGATVSPRIFARSVVKAALGWLGGVPYTPYWGDVTGMDWHGVEHVYTPLPEFTPAPRERVIPIALVSSETPSARPPCGCVYLGQNVEHYLTRHHYEWFCSSALVFVRSLGYDPVFYKPHHFESVQSRAFFEANGLRILDDPRSIEQIFTERPFECVVSYNTSAFVNLRLIYGECVRCISYGNDHLIQFSWRDRPYGRRMSEIFQRLGVEIVTVSDTPSRY